MRTMHAMAAALLALAATAPAQDVVLRGKVEDVSGTTNRFVVDCTDTALTSAAFDLNAWVGQQVELTGTWNGSSASPSVEVTAIAPIAESFEIGGGAKIGDQAVFAVTSNPGDLTVMFAALGAGFAPTRRAGTLLLDANPIVEIGSGVVRGDGRLEITVDIPDDPSIVGIEVFGQALIAFAAGGKTWSNPDCKTISQ